MERDDVISGRAIAHVAHGLGDVGRVENDRTRPDAHPFVFHKCLDGSLLHNDDLIVGTLENLMVGGARIEGGGMALQHIESGGGSFEELPAGAGRICFGFEGIPFNGG